MLIKVIPEKIMSSLSTLEEYQSIAEELALPKSAYIDSKFKTAASGATFDTVNSCQWSGISEYYCLWSRRSRPCGIKSPGSI